MLGKEYYFVNNMLNSCYNDDYDLSIEYNGYISQEASWEA